MCECVVVSRALCLLKSKFTLGCGERREREGRRNVCTSEFPLSDSHCLFLLLSPPPHVHVCLVVLLCRCACVCMCVQEAIKLLIHQYMPLNNTFIFNGVHGSSLNFEF